MEKTIRMQLFDIFPKPQEVYTKWVRICKVAGCGLDCIECPYGKTVRENTCFDICLKGDWDLWMHYYDMSKPLLRRYIGPYEWEKDEC